MMTRDQRIVWNKAMERAAEISERPRIQDAMVGDVSISADGLEIARDIRSAKVEDRFYCLNCNDTGQYLDNDGHFGSLYCDCSKGQALQGIGCFGAVGGSCPGARGVSIPKGIAATETDIGRKVIYRSAPNYEPEEGIITSIGRIGNVFVRYGSSIHSQSTNQSDLDWSLT